jgi:methionyl-tRNA formyltransferase
MFRARRLVVWKAKVSRTDDDRIEPGVIGVARACELAVGCGEQSVLLLEEVQPEGRRRMSARDFLNGLHAQPGEELG